MVRGEVNNSSDCVVHLELIYLGVCDLVQTLKNVGCALIEKRYQNCLIDSDPNNTNMMVIHAFTSLSLYRTNAILNVATFVLFRILLLGWMTRWLTIHRDDVPIIFFTVGSLGLATIVGMNIVLFYRILVGDYLGSKKKTRGTEAVTEDKTEEGGNEAKPSVEFTDCTSLPSSTHRRRQPHHLTKDVNRIVDGALRLVE